ncbi:hypothetical protein BFG52_14985 [Acinetobacter larvae]|uniref:Uncharacterized protein n=1 Tax=Acinetobacter larvae TaxID=1789224 RepID=A0A1B2M3D1_9GAMM|nr:hypothetical protein [Acinetobacter larvae]AOA59523.1 hypothetical protein BFG52_14985 [Acinetobacter larvae]
MLNNFYKVAKAKISIAGKAACFSVTVFAGAQSAMASPVVDQLSDCLVKSTTASDKTIVLQWTFAALSAHPDLKSFSAVTPEQKTQLDQKLAQVLQRIVVDQCAVQAKAVIKAEGIQAVADSFQQLGQITGQEIIGTPEVKQQLNGVVRYIDLNKLVTSFLTPDVLSKFGL